MPSVALPPIDASDNVRVFTRARRHRASYDYARRGVVADAFRKIPIVPLLLGLAFVALAFVSSEGEGDE